MTSLLLPNCSGDLKYGPYPPARDWGSRVSGLVDPLHRWSRAIYVYKHRSIHVQRRTKTPQQPCVRLKAALRDNKKDKRRHIQKPMHAFHDATVFPLCDAPNIAQTIEHIHVEFVVAKSFTVMCTGIYTDICTAYVRTTEEVP